MPGTAWCTASTRPGTCEGTPDDEPGPRPTAPTRRVPPRGSRQTREATDQGAGSAKAQEKEGHRETVEAIVVAFILALLVRGFEAEAFVIPTGSMAPTLMGRHKEITCPQCGYVYAVNASEKVEGRGRTVPERRRTAGSSAGSASTAATRRTSSEAPSFKGDRILVMKFPYDLPFLPGSSGPQRWDVVVFRYPEEPEVSYIKRLSGCPARQSASDFGDILHQAPGEQGVPPRAEAAAAPARPCRSWCTTTRHRPAALNDQPEWRRWAPTTADAWTGGARRGRSWSRPPPGQEAELRYRHLVPDPEQWQAILAGEPLPRVPRADADHRLLLVQHQPHGRQPDVSLGDVPRRRGRPGSSPTGSAT